MGFVYRPFHKTNKLVVKYSTHLQLVFAINPNKVKYGTCGTGADYFVEWREDKDYISWQKEVCERVISDGQILEQDKIAVSMLSQNRL